MTHAEAQPVFERHWPEWTKHPGTDILVFHPASGAIATPPAPGCAVYDVGFGDACHHGPESIRRFRWLLRLLGDQTQYHGFTIHEYDSLSLRTEPGPFIDGQLTGLVYRDDRPDRGFVGTTYIHPPLSMTRATLWQIITAMESVPDDAERGFWDRWLGLVCERGMIGLNNGLAGFGFSRNTIEAGDIAAAVEAVRAGAYLLHGVKTEECYRAVKTA